MVEHRIPLPLTQVPVRKGNGNNIMNEQNRNQAPGTIEPAVKTNLTDQDKELDQKELDKVSGGGLVVGTLSSKPE
jgi:bacteriocin-like protein